MERRSHFLLGVVIQVGGCAREKCESPRDQVRRLIWNVWHLLTHGELLTPDLVTADHGDASSSLGRSLLHLLLFHASRFRKTRDQLGLTGTQTVGSKDDFVDVVLIG